MRIGEGERGLAKAGLPRVAADAGLCKAFLPVGQAAGRHAKGTSTVRPVPTRPGCMCDHGKKVRSVPGVPTPSA